MALEDEEIEVYNYTFSSSDDNIDYVCNELHKSLLKFNKELDHANKKNESLINQVELIEKEINDLNILVEKLLSENKSYSQCETYKALVKINELTKASQMVRKVRKYFRKLKEFLK